MSGSPFKDAWRTRLATHRSAAGYTATWPIKDVDNTAEHPGVPSDAVQGFLEFEFPGGPPDRQYTFGAPGSNLHDERGQVTLRVVSRLRAGATLRDAAEAIAEAMRSRFRNDRFDTSAGRTIRVDGVSPLSDGFDEGGTYVVTVLLSYQMFNVG